MHRADDRVILRAFQKNLDGYWEFFDTLMAVLLRSDIGKGDRSAALVDNVAAEAVVRAKERGIVAGIEEAIHLVKSQNLDYTALVADGQSVEPGQEIMHIKGGKAVILMLERTILNVMQRMSGIATATNRLVKLASPAHIAGTRKTLWGLVDKKAIMIGGGLTHRLGLYDGIMLKNNHISGVDFTKLLRSAYQNRGAVDSIEIEVRTIEEAKMAADTMRSLDPGFPFVIMLDNMPPFDIEETAKQIGQRTNIILEASGGINESNCKDYSNCGVDVISIGYLSHSVKALDINLNIL